MTSKKKKNQQNTKNKTTQPKKQINMSENKDRENSKISFSDSVLACSSINTIGAEVLFC